MSPLLAATLLVLVSTAAVHAVPVGDEVSKRVETLSQVTDVPVNCIWCQFGLHLIDEQLITLEQSQKNLNDWLQAECMSLLPANATKQCPLYAGIISSYLWNAEHANPMVYCKQLKVCPTTVNVLPGGTADLVNMRHRSFQFVDGSHLLCQLCEESVSLLKKFITAHLDSLENDVIIEFCNRLPKLPSEHCKEAIHDDIPNLVDEFLDPQQLCHITAFC